jgi:hypothetical protein
MCHYVRLWATLGHFFEKSKVGGNFTEITLGSASVSPLLNLGEGLVKPNPTEVNRSQPNLTEALEEKNFPSNANERRISVQAEKSPRFPE